MPGVATVEYQPQAAALNDEGKQSLAELLHNDAARKRLRARHDKAAQILETVAGIVNERAFEARQRHSNKLRRLESKEEEEPEEELAEYDEYQEKVKDVTKRLELEVRGLIDDADWLTSVPDTLKAMAIKSGAVADATQRTQSSIALTTQRSRRNADDEDEEQEDIEMSGTNTQTVTAQLDPADAPAAQLQSEFEKQASAWNARSLTDRYAKSNYYRGFYTNVHASKYQGTEEVPVPHDSIWFAAEEGRQVEANTLSQADGEDDDELQIGAVNIRITCPFTTKVLEDTLSSKKCPHYFESSSFVTVLKETNKHLPFTPEQLLELQGCRGAERTRKEKEMKIPAVPCPECNVLLAEDDVERDPILRRKIGRMIAQNKKQREANAEADSDDEDDDDLPRGTQRKPVGLGSSPASTRASGRIRNFKAESGRSTRSSMTPGTQTTARRASVNEVEDEEGEDEDEDEEMEDE